VATFSQDLSRLEQLEQQYRQLISEYQSELVAYQTLHERDPADPQLAKRYERVQNKNNELQKVYSELEQLRSSLSPGQGASSAGFRSG
jgi:predicted RNase H-like nuclease (RuvC/YqgF family)